MWRGHTLYEKYRDLEGESNETIIEVLRVRGKELGLGEVCTLSDLIWRIHLEIHNAPPQTLSNLGRNFRY